MTTKEYLRQVERLNLIIEDKMTEIETLRGIASRLSGNTENERVQTSLTKDKIGDIVSKIVDKEEELKVVMGEHIETKSIIIKQIEGITNNTFYKILTKKYIRFQSLTQIADDMGYSKRQIDRLHGKALLDFESQYGEKYLKL